MFCILWGDFSGDFLLLRDALGGVILLLWKIKNLIEYSLTLPGDRTHVELYWTSYTWVINLKTEQIKC